MKKLVKTLFVIIEEIVLGILSPIFGRIKSKYLLFKYRKFKSAKTFDWDWNKVNYNRIALVNLLLHGKINGTYLEIGCDNNALFDSIPLSKKIGVDPNHGGNMKLESDKFFDKNIEKFDVIFIDGLHTYDQIRRDVVNSLKFIKSDGWIGMHDLLPRNWIEEHVPRIFQEGAWSGDVWKVAFELSNTKGLEFKIIDIDRGVGLCRKIDQEVYLADKMAELNAVEFPYLHDNIEKLPIINWETAYNWIKNTSKTI